MSDFRTFGKIFSVAKLNQSPEDPCTQMLSLGPVNEVIPRGNKLRIEKFGLYIRSNSRHTLRDNNYNGEIFFLGKNELPQAKFPGLAKMSSF